VVDLTLLPGLRGEARGVSVNSQKDAGVRSGHGDCGGGYGGGEAQGALQGSPCTLPGMGDSGESPKQRHDRELIELLNELRVAIPGVQVLFAFLLAVPFAQGWKRVTPFQKDVFFVAFLATAMSSVLLIAPSAYHRIGWRSEDKGRIVEASNKLAIAGLFFLAVSIASVVLLVTDYIFDKTTAIATTAGVGVLFLVFWCVLPLAGRARS
jgi:hypothetical protein